MKKSYLLILFALLGVATRLGALPPPPAFNPEGATALGGNPLKPEDKGDLPDYEAQDAAAGNKASDLAAPQISEEQMIKNAMDMAFQLYHAEDYKAAAQTTAVILEKYPKRKLYWVAYLQALCLEHQELYEQAIENYKHVKKWAPHSTYANSAAFRVAMCEVHLGRDTDAIFTLHDIIETQPRSEYRLQAYVHLGNLYRRSRHWSQAQGIYKDLIRLYPDTTWAFTAMLYLAECYAFQERPDKAIGVYERMQGTRSVPAIFKAQAQMRIGDIHMDQKNWQQAILAYRVALRDYAEMPGVELAAEEKVAQAQEARRAGKARYKSSKYDLRVINDSHDKDQSESVPY
jgi:TolA-binding protein